jgi:hypothetical protein
MNNQLPTEEQLIRQLTSLPRDIAPVNDVWPGIAGRITTVPATAMPGKYRVRSRFVAVAAAVLVAFVAGLIMDGQRTGHDPAAPAGVTERSPALAIDQIYLVESGAGSELEYRAAFKEFLALNGLPAITENPGAAPMYLGWEATRQAEIALTEALRHEPENSFLVERLKTLRARQLELLQTIAALELAARRNAI